MIFIEQNFLNKIVLRLNDKRTSLNSFFLWELKNEFSKEVTYFMLDDLSEYECAYSLFHFDHNFSGSTSGGINVPMFYVGGQYEYKIYETFEQSLEMSAVTGSYIDCDMLFVEIPRTVNTSGATNNIYY